jgi:hypothetical protein
MAIRKGTMQEQVALAIAQINPGDRPIVTIHGITGPNPILLSGLFGVISQFFVKYYFITITEQAVVFHAANRFSNQPKELVLAVPRPQAPTLVSNAKRGNLWSYFHFQFPGEEKPTRINVARQWRAELDQFMPVITTPVG